jgi:hypothetical protein
LRREEKYRSFAFDDLTFVNNVDDGLTDDSATLLHIGLGDVERRDESGATARTRQSATGNPRK